MISLSIHFQITHQSQHILIVFQSTQICVKNNSITIANTVNGFQLISLKQIYHVSTGPYWLSKCPLFAQYDLGQIERLMCVPVHPNAIFYALRCKISLEKVETVGLMVRDRHKFGRIDTLLKVSQPSDGDQKPAKIVPKEKYSSFILSSFEFVSQLPGVQTILPRSVTLRTSSHQRCVYI